MIRNIIKIDKDKCNGCGICINACHEGALTLVEGKAHLISDSYCDGLGACLPSCPQDAIKIEQREAQNFDEELVMQRIRNLEINSNNKQINKENLSEKIKKNTKISFGCPGMAEKIIKKNENLLNNSENKNTEGNNNSSNKKLMQSRLSQWPCQIKLVNPTAPYFNDAHILVAADCTAFAYANIHEDFIKNKITIIGCPKLDSIEYCEKLSEIISHNNIKSITVLRMEVPCCGGIVEAVKKAIIISGKIFPWNIVKISINGEILED